MAYIVYKEVERVERPEWTPPPPKRKRKHQTPHAKLSASDVLAIYKAKGYLADIAAQYGMSKSSISAIRLGKTWSHITGHKK